MSIEIVQYDQLILNLSWKWLNDPEIKRLTNTPAFTKSSQLEWFSSLPEKKNYFIRGVLYNSIPVGVCGLKVITLKDAEYWGYIGEKQYWGKGIGSSVLMRMESHAIDLSLQSIWLKVLVDNINAIRFYSKNGYQVESINEAVQIMRKRL